MAKNNIALPVSIVEEPLSSRDIFGRTRISDSISLFSSKQLYDNQPLIWDDQQTNGSGTSSTYLNNQSATRINVGNVIGTRVRQTFQRFNYQPGKSQQIFVTWSEFDTTPGITKRVGYFDDNNGLFFQSSNGILSIVRRTKTSGEVVDNVITQNLWNLDKLDNSGLSNTSLDIRKSQLGVIDFQWLGVGRIKMGLVVDDLIHYCHEFINSNVLDTVYMSSPNLPVRYEISNDGTGNSDSFVHICASVQSDGGTSDIGVIRHSHNLSVGPLSSGNNYALIGIRLQNNKLDNVVKIRSVSLISNSTNDQGHWMFILNPTISGVFNYNNIDNSAVQIAKGTSSNTLINGVHLNGGFFSTSISSSIEFHNALNLGSSINNVPQEIVLSIIPLTNNITVSANIDWMELS